MDLDYRRCRPSGVADGLIVRAGTDALFHATLADFFPPLRVASDEHGRACAMPQAILV